MVQISTKKLRRKKIPVCKGACSILRVEVTFVCHAYEAPMACMPGCKCVAFREACDPDEGDEGPRAEESAIHGFGLTMPDNIGARADLYTPKERGAQTILGGEVFEAFSFVDLTQLPSATKLSIVFAGSI